MKSGALKRALGLAVLYIGLFIVIVIAQFSKGQGLSERFGSLSVNASYAKADRGKAGAAPERVSLSYAGLAVEISASSPVQAIGADGSSAALPLASIDRLADGVRVGFARGVALTARV